jgi:hypothetical protein
MLVESVNKSSVNKNNINNPDLFQIKAKNRIYQGANQIWYKTRFQRLAGCGPTTCSNIMWYLSRTKKGYQSLCEYDGSTKDGFLKLMEDVYKCVTPSMMGVRNTKMFITGALQYGLSKGITLECRELLIPSTGGERPEKEEVFKFLQDAFTKNLPVAFLNLSNGKLENLESWHWVTLMGINPETGFATMNDQSQVAEIDLALWLESSFKGGGFVAVE